MSHIHESHELSTPFFLAIFREPFSFAIHGKTIFCSPIHLSEDIKGITKDNLILREHFQTTISNAWFTFLSILRTIDPLFVTIELRFTLKLILYCVYILLKLILIVQ